ncbi:MAG: hypothetical protein MUF11_13655 [Beijerinckiaceae bacterium]|jgi:hypothetical protein|nr:hypothetical protein [Beijerinckiaceae bacterium]
MRKTHLVATGYGLMMASLLFFVPQAESENFSRWPELVNPFESTSGGGVMIDRYAPVVVGATCRTDFTVTLPNNGGTFLNEVVFDAIPVQGGILCENGRWRAKDGSAEGTTPFRVFLKDGIARRPPA